MGLKGKLIMEVEIKSSGDVFHKLFASSPHQVPNIVPSHFQSCNLHEGEFGKNGSIVSWNYTLAEKQYWSKHIIENLDEEKKTVTFKEIGGDMLRKYKAMSVHLQVVSEPDNINLVKWCLDYERENEDAPHPLKELEFALTMTLSIEAHHSKA